MNILQTIIEAKQDNYENFKDLIPEICLAIQNITKDTGKVSVVVSKSEFEDNVTVNGLKEYFKTVIELMFQEHLDKDIYASWLNPQVKKDGENFILSVDFTYFVYGLTYANRKYLKYVKSAIKQFDEKYYTANRFGEIIVDLKLNSEDGKEKYTINSALKSCGFNCDIESFEDKILKIKIKRPSIQF